MVIPAAAQPAGQDAEVYASACAACHGPDGRGAPQTALGFDLAMPDFSDCSFATREPDADWGAVVHDGGPARGFDRLMPAFGGALTGEEIQSTLDHVRTFCDQPAWPLGELNLPRPLFTEKAYPEDEAVITTSVDTEGDGAVTNTLVYERRFGARNQAELVVPFPARRVGGEWLGDVGDVALAVKRAMFHDGRRGTIFSVGSEIILPTGNREDGLGKGTAVIEPFASFGQILPADGFLHLQAGLELPTDRQVAERELFWRAALGKTFTQGRFGRAWSPMVEILGGRELVSGDTPQWDVVPQMQVTLNTRQHVMANVGVRLPVTDAGIRRTSLVVYLLWDWFDGGLLEGW